MAEVKSVKLTSLGAFTGGEFMTDENGDLYLRVDPQSRNGLSKRGGNPIVATSHGFVGVMTTKGTVRASLNVIV